jgi:hypothetical protein
MRVLVLVFLVLSGAPAFGDFIIEDPGCYRLTGRVESLKDGLLAITLSPGSRSETLLFVESATEPAKGDYYQFTAALTEKGALRKGSKVKGSSFRPVSRQELKSLDLLTHVSELKKGTCE